MEAIVKNKLYTVEEYFKLEESSELRHEFINGQLFEMSGASKKHHLTIQRIERYLAPFFEPKNYLIYRETMKVKIYNEQKYYYPDIFITAVAEPLVVHALSSMDMDLQ